MEWTQIPDLSEILLSLGKHPTQGPDMPEGTLPTAPGRIIEALVTCAPRGLMVKELAQLLYLSPGWSWRGWWCGNHRKRTGGRSPSV